MPVSKPTTLSERIARGALLSLTCLAASCASSLPSAMQDKRPHGNAGSTLRDLSSETWIFETSSDPMTGASGYSSSIWSLTTVQLSYPYQGDQKLTLRVGRSPQVGSYAVVAIPHGQFSCYQCDIRIRFDSRDTLLFTADSRSEVSGLLFITGADRFIEQLRNSKKVMIELPFFDNPRKAVEFKSNGFPW